MYIRLSIAPKRMANTKERPHSMGSDHWFATYFDKGGNVNKYIDMIEKKYNVEKFDDDERRRFLVAHMSNEFALKLALYLRERGICIFNSTYDEDIKYMRAIFETAEQREERLKKEKKLAGIEDDDLCHAEIMEEQIKAEEAEALKIKKALDIKVLLMKCGLKKSNKPKDDEILPNIKEERASAVKEERPLDSKEENALNVKKEKKANDKKNNQESHVYEGILLTNESLNTNDTNHASDNITKQIINDIMLEKSKPPFKKSETDNNKSKVIEHISWRSPITEFEKKKEKYLKTMYKFNGIIFKESQVAQNGEMSVIARLSHLLDTGQFADVNIRVGTGNNAAIFKAHRLLLATASQPLHKLVYSVNPNPGPKEITTIRLQDMTPQEFEHVLKYIYTDAICCKSVDEAFNLLKAAKRFGLFGLSTRSLEFLEKFIEDFQPSDDESKNSLFDLLVMAQEKRLNDLTEKCWSLLYKFVEDVIPCESFLNLEYDVTLKLFSNADFKYTDQLKLFHAIRDWGLTYIKRKNKKVQEMGELVAELMKCIDFSKIEDGDFVQSVLTSNCLGKAELITFFMSHGMDVPRDISNNKQGGFWAMFLKSSEKESEKLKNNQQGPEGSAGSTQLETISENDKMNGIPNGTGPDYKKVRRFKKGYLLPQTEISLEHELRFRCDKNIKLFGVGCGFLFSNTDMGVALHCQGPWETKQWTDMMQRTYCRVSSDKQEIANISLMYAAPLELQANQSYKILVKIVRMSGGSSEVDLWGGTEGNFSVENDGDEFCFLKAAVDPTKTVEESEGDIKPSLITEIYYTISDGAQVLHPVGSTPRRQRGQEKKESVVSPPPIIEQQREQALDVFAPKEIRRRQRDPIRPKTPEDTTAVLRSFMESGSVVGGIRKRSNEQKSDSNTYTNRWDTSDKSTEPSSTTNYKPAESPFTTSYTQRTRYTDKPAESSSITRCRESIDRSIETTSNITKRRESLDKQEKEAERTKAAENISSILASRRHEPPPITEKPSFMRRREAAAEAAVPWAGRTSLKSSLDSTPGWLSRSASASRASTLSDTTPSLRSRDTSLSRFGTTGGSSSLTSRFGSGSSSTTGDPPSQPTDQIIPSEQLLEEYLSLAAANDQSVSDPSIQSTRQKIPSKQQKKKRKKNKKSKGNLSPATNDQTDYVHSTVPTANSISQNVSSQKQSKGNLPLATNVYVHSTEPPVDSISQNVLSKKQPEENLTLDTNINDHSTEPPVDSTSQNISPQKQPKGNLPPSKTDHSVDFHSAKPPFNSTVQNIPSQKHSEGNLPLSTPDQSVFVHSVEAPVGSTGQNVLPQKKSEGKLPLATPDHSVYDYSADSTGQNVSSQKQHEVNLPIATPDDCVFVRSVEAPVNSTDINISSQQQLEKNHPISPNGQSAYKIRYKLKIHPEYKQRKLHIQTLKINL